MKFETLSAEAEGPVGRLTLTRPERLNAIGPTALLELADRIKGSSTEAAVVLGGIEAERVGIVASFSEGAVAAGLNANEIVQAAAGIVGGGGGGRW